MSAHSQGSLIAATVLARLDEDERPRGFLTHGSQLGVLYPSMFPTVGIDEICAQLATAYDGRWMNFWRPTDPIGGHRIAELGSCNVEVVEGAGHSGHEPTKPYTDARRRIVANSVVGDGRATDTDGADGPGRGDSSAVVAGSGAIEGLSDVSHTGRRASDSDVGVDDLTTP